MLILKNINLSFLLLKLMWRRKNSLLITLLVSLLLGVYFRLGYQQFLYLQAQNISGLSVFNEIILPLAGLTLACQVLMSLLMSAQLYPSFFSSGQGALFQQSSLKKSKLALNLFMPISCFGFWPIINFMLLSLLLACYTSLDFYRLILCFFGLILINLVTSSIFLAISLRVKNLLLSIIFSLLIIGLLIVIEISLNALQLKINSGISWRGLFLPFLNFRQGLLVFADVINYLGWLILLVNICLWLLSEQQKQKKYLRSISIVLAFMLIFLSGYLPGQFDLTSDKRSSLPTELIAQINERNEKLEIYAVIDEETSRDEIMRGLQVIQQFIPDVIIHYESKQSLGPEAHNIGEYIQFKLGAASHKVLYPFEQDVKLVFETSIKQLLLRKNSWITFIEGHGESSIFAQKSSDLGALYKLLTDMGWHVASQNLLSIPLISDNTQLLVIASSKTDWLAKEVKVVNDYLLQGRNLLLLCDPDCVLPEQIEDDIGIARLPGTLVDWNGYQSGTPHPAVVIVDNKSNHVIARNINSILAFPWASGLTVNAKQNDPDIFYEPIITTDKNVWSEFNINQKQLAYDQEQGELQQSFVLAMSRYNAKNEQKIVVVGDSHFASDSAINNYANKQFVLNMINWLNEGPANKKQGPSSLKYAMDNSIAPTRLGHFLMNWFFSVIFPLLILFFWWMTYWLRARAIEK